MKIILQRFDECTTCTIGTLSINGKFICFTLEDTARDLIGGDTKIYGDTAIPVGIYEVVLDKSNRFGKILPRLIDVPWFTGIRIHAGNTAQDSLGCILVGLSHTVNSNFIGSSKKALKRLMKLLSGVEQISIEVRNV